jgi:hypothetical protein
LAVSFIADTAASKCYDALPLVGAARRRDGSDVLALSSTKQVLQALTVASRIDVQAYTLHGAVLHAVESAARRGAEVSVELEGDPFNDAKGSLASENRRLAGELRGAGADATLGHPLHAKAVAADGALFLDEKNWQKNDLVLRVDDPAEAREIPMIKHEALAAEAKLVNSARNGDGAIVESESFGAHNAVYSALDRLAQNGLSARLLVAKRDLANNARELQAIERLAGDGVRVRVCGDSAKLAAVGDAAWLGSANATLAAPECDSTDGGLCTKNQPIVEAVRERLEMQWRAAKPFKCRTA